MVTIDSTRGRGALCARSVAATAPVNRKSLRLIISSLASQRLSSMFLLLKQVPSPADRHGSALSEDSFDPSLAPLFSACPIITDPSNVDPGFPSAPWQPSAFWPISRVLRRLTPRGPIAPKFEAARLSRWAAALQPRAARGPLGGGLRPRGESVRAAAPASRSPPGATAGRQAEPVPPFPPGPRWRTCASSISRCSCRNSSRM